VCECFRSFNAENGNLLSDTVTSVPNVGDFEPAIGQLIVHVLGRNPNTREEANLPVESDGVSVDIDPLDRCVKHRGLFQLFENLNQEF
jgi:hypothetical protein